MCCCTLSLTIFLLGDEFLHGVVSDGDDGVLVGVAVHEEVAEVESGVESVAGVQCEVPEFEDAFGVQHDAGVVVEEVDALALALLGLALAEQPELEVAHDPLAGAIEEEVVRVLSLEAQLLDDGGAAVGYGDAHQVLYLSAPSAAP